MQFYFSMTLIIEGYNLEFGNIVAKISSSKILKNNFFVQYFFIHSNLFQNSQGIEAQMSDQI